MRIFYIFCLLLLGFDVEADFSSMFNNLVKTGKNLVDEFSGDKGRRRYNKSSRSRSQQRNRRLSSDRRDNRRTDRRSDRKADNIRISLIDRKKLFDGDRVEMAKISHDGKMWAYVARHEDAYSLHVSEIDRRNSPETIIKEKDAHIDGVEFVSNDSLVYWFRDQKDNVQLIHKNLKTKAQTTIDLDRDTKEIEKIIKSKTSGEFLVVCCDDRDNRTSYRISAKNPKKVKGEEYEPGLYGDDLRQPLLTSKTSGSRADVYFAGKRDDVKIDSLRDADTEKYISVGDKEAFKLVEEKDKVVFVSVDLKNQKESRFTVGRNIRIEDCNVSFDGDRQPLLVNVTSNGRSSNETPYKAQQEHINTIDKKFKGSDWRLMDSAMDGDAWLICVTNPEKPDRYFAYDSRRRGFTEVADFNKLGNNSVLQETVCKNISTRDNSIIKGFLTKSANHNSNRPMLVMVGSDVTKKSQWSFNPLAQLLANRGCSVLILNFPDPDDDSDDDDANGDEADDIVDAVKWCVKNNICARENICICANDKHCKAAVMAFEENQGLFSSGIFLPGDRPNDKGILSYINMDDVDNPIMIISEEENCKNDGDEDAAKSAKKDLKLSYFTYRDRVYDLERSAIIELFLSVIHGVDRSEKVSDSDIKDFDAVLDANEILKDVSGNKNRGKRDKRDNTRRTRHNRDSKDSGGGYWDENRSNRSRNRRSDPFL
ncbi:hypothetical protein FACS1894122_07090 [Alphaproteobacteria bacterium]|nr:hypothetical protein FACS1894122_07090 [Alphaproteobacteria bacterium]